MSLFTLCSSIVSSLNNSTPENWGNIIIPTDLQAVLVLDPDVLYQTRDRRLFVMPVQHMPMDFSGRNSTRSQFLMNYVFSIGLLLPLDSFQNEDVSEAGDISAALELWERIDMFVIRNIPEPYTLKEVVPEPPVEVEMNQKNFLVLTEFTVEAEKCI
jgi:hypothetical protein